MSSDSAGTGHGNALYSSEELALIRRVQRAFRVHVRTQAAEAEEVLHAARSSLSPEKSQQASHGNGLTTTSGGNDDDSTYERLCQILRKCSFEQHGEAALSLSAEEQNVLSKLQQAIRDHLERKRLENAPGDSLMQIAPQGSE